MNTIHVELSSTSPMLHNRCWSDGSGWCPTTDLAQAGSRLFTRQDGSLYLPWNRPVIAIGRAAHSRGMHSPCWPTEIIHAEACVSLSASPVAFDGEWTPHVFARDGLPHVALPRFDRWTASFKLEYDPAYYDEVLLRELLEHVGRHLGLPQFAPFTGPGPWGRFEVEGWEPSAKNSNKSNIDLLTPSAACGIVGHVG
jgi:hypothetical protein